MGRGRGRNAPSFFWDILAFIFSTSLISHVSLLSYQTIVFARLYTKQANTPLWQWSCQNKNLIFVCFFKQNGAMHSNNDWNQEDAQTRTGDGHFLLFLHKHDTVMKQPTNTWNLLHDVLEDIFCLTISGHNLDIHNKTDAIICFWLSIQSNCVTNTCCIPSVNPLVYFTCMQEQQMFCLSELNSAPC